MLDLPIFSGLYSNSAHLTAPVFGLLFAATIGASFGGDAAFIMWIEGAEARSRMP
jgi:hypothetical protein